MTGDSRVRQRGRHSRLGLGIAFIASAILPFFGVACGSILGIDDPTDRPQMIVSPPEEAGDAAGTCPANEKMCSGVCVANNDPEFGCGMGDCVACPSPQNAKAGCVAAGCGFTDCRAGFGNCDMNPANGCETQLTTKSACGRCGIDCSTETPPHTYCTPGGGGVFTCTDSCSLPNIVCTDGECVDPMTDPKHCGDSCTDCTVANGTGTCNAGVCSVTCDSPFCRVGNLCLASDNSHCYSASPQCSACPGTDVCLNAGSGGCVAVTCTPDSMHCGPTCAFCSGHCTLGGSCACTSPQDDMHCGIDCNVDCASAGEICVSGSCAFPKDASMDGPLLDGPSSDGAMSDGFVPPPIDGAACFIAGTPIILANGSTKPIEEIEVGDEVLSYDTTTGTEVKGSVVRLFVHPHTRRLARLNGIVTTPEHRFFANGAWAYAGALAIGDTLTRAEPTLEGSSSQPLLTAQTADELLMISGDTTTYNFEVAVFHDYFAGSYLVHNGGKGPVGDF